jgi:plasmid stability protein
MASILTVEPRIPMSLTINLPAETEKQLLARAAANGKDVDTFVREVIEEKLHTLPSFDEVCAPLRQAVEASGITEDELDALFREALAEVRREKRGRADKSP